jgi:hypothetical protein
MASSITFRAHYAVFAGHVKEAMQEQAWMELGKGMPQRDQHQPAT